MLAERSVAYWLHKAEKARARADELDDAARQAMLDIAARYDVRAQQAEGRDVRVRTRPEKPAPARTGALAAVRRTG